MIKIIIIEIEESIEGEVEDEVEAEEGVEEEVKVIKKRKKNIGIHFKVLIK